MKKLLVRLVRQSPAMVVAMLALFVALTGTAVATTSALIGGAQIRNNSITGADIKNKSLRPIDFRGSVRGARGVRGLPGTPGPAGAQGVQGAKGDKGDKGDAAVVKRTRLNYNLGNTDSTITFTFEKLRDVASFTKDHADTAIKLIWNAHGSHGGTPGTEFCDFQLRIDDANNGGIPLGGGRAILYGSDAPISVTAIFTGLAAGSHNVSIWVRGSAASCTLNKGNFPQDIYVEEIA